MGKRKTIPEQDTGENQKPASWYVSTPLVSGQNLPTGTVTFLFSDIEGSTPHWERNPALMEEALKLHNEVLFNAIEANGGKVFKIVGDEFQAVFTTAPQALRAAIDIQLGLRSAEWNEIGPLKVRIGLHTGEAQLDDIGDEYAVSHTKNRAGRIRSAAHGGQILLSQESADLVQRILPDAIELEDLGEYRLKGMQWLEHLHQVIAPELETEFPPLDTLSRPKHNLPLELTSFIGREKEIDTIIALLRVNRLVTLTGVGGTGKTRLALEAAGLTSSGYPDGVYFVPFASVESPEFVAQTLADGLGLRYSDQLDPQEQVVRYLREKTILLVIDNFEHLLAGTNVLVEILVRSNHVKMLVTSRERLQLKEEWIFDVHGLQFPEIGPGGQRQLNPAEYEAGQLFLQTAQRARSDFSPDEHDQAYIARICQLVGGMPLAIELAASWVRLLPCAEIVNQIMHNLDILTTSWRDVPNRHRSLRAVLDHSWELLSQDEREVFSGLTVFNGNFRLQAVGSVVGTSFMLLLDLVDKSFLQRVDEEYFAIHELMKQYGSEKLQADPEQWQVRKLQHCRYHASYLKERMNAVDANTHLDEVAKVFDDLQSAWRFAVENELLAEIQQLSAGFMTYYQLHSWYRAGSGALELYLKALACFNLETENLDQRTTIACLYESIGELQELSTAHDDALRAIERGLEYTPEDDFLQRGRLCGKMAEIWVAKNQLDQGYAYYSRAEQILELAPTQNGAWWVEWLNIQLKRMQLLYWQNRPDDMAETAGKISTLIERYASVTQHIEYLYSMGLYALRRDKYFHSNEAIQYNSEALRLSLETGNLGDIAYHHFSYGFSHLWSDHYEEAEKHLQITRQMSEQSGDPTLLTRAMAYLGVVYRKRGDHERTREYADYTLQNAEEAKMPQYTGMAYAHYAWLAWLSGDLQGTHLHGQAAIQAWGGLGAAQLVMPFRWLALFPLIGVALQDGKTEKAVEFAQHLLAPSEQRLPDDLTNLLKRSVSEWVEDSPSRSHDLLQQAFQLAHEMGYV